MRPLTALAGIFLLCLIFTYTSCTNGSGTIFRTKEDSLAFAKNYFEKYPGENNVRVKYGGDTTMKGLTPISWPTVKAYQSNYDKNPFILSPAGVPLNGFNIDSAGYTKLLNSKNIKGLYLRFGVKSNGAFTILILGTDAKGNVMKDTIRGGVGDGTGTNYDETPPCPVNCPTEPD